MESQRVGRGRRPRRPATAINEIAVWGGGGRPWFSIVRGRGRRPRRPGLRAAEDVRPYRWRASRVPNGGVKVVWLGTDHRLSLAQNPVLLAGQIAVILASCNRDVDRLRKRRQVAGREEGGPPSTSNLQLQLTPSPPSTYRQKWISIPSL